MAILDRFSAILLSCNSTHYFASRCGNSGDSRPTILGIVRFAIRCAAKVSVLFSFLPLCWPPHLPPVFLVTFLPLSPSPSKSALFCTAKGTAQSLVRGSFRMDLSTKFGKPSSFPGSTCKRVSSETQNISILSVPLYQEALKVRSEKLQNESFPNFSNFRPEFCPEFCSECFEEFSCFVSWETETRKKSRKIPVIFQWKIPRQIRKINSQNVSGERAKQLKGGI